MGGLCVVYRPCGTPLYTFSPPYYSESSNFMTKRKEANRTILDLPVGKCFASAGEKPMILCM